VWVVAVPFQIAELTVELPFATLLNPPELCHVVTEPFLGTVETWPLLIEDHVTSADLKAVTELAPHLKAGVGSAIVRELSSDGSALEVGQGHYVAVKNQWAVYSYS
jgi:hypothetical protein